MILSKQSILKLLNRCDSPAVKIIVGSSFAFLCLIFSRNLRVSYLLLQIFRKEDLKYSVRLANYTFALSTGTWIFSDPTFVFVERLKLNHLLEYSKLNEQSRISDDDLECLTASLFLIAKGIEQKKYGILTELDEFKRIANTILEADAKPLPRKPKTIVQIHNSSKKLDFQVLAHEAMSDWLEIFAAIQEKFFLISGTFLGAVRLGDFLPHDYDIDFGIMAKDFNYDDFCENINKSDNFSIKNIAYISEKKIDGENYVTSRTNLGLIKIIHRSGINIDLFIHHDVDQVYLHGSSYHIWRNSYFELSDYQIGNVWMKGPADYDRYLTENYGDWTTPKIDFNFIVDTPNLTFVHNLVSLAVKIKQQSYLNNDKIKILLLDQINKL